MGLKEKLFRRRGGDKAKANSPVTDADDVAQEYVKLDVIKQVRQERREQRHSKGSSIESQPTISDKITGASQQSTSSDMYKKDVQKGPHSDWNRQDSQKGTHSDKNRQDSQKGPHSDKDREDSQNGPHSHMKSGGVGRLQKSAYNDRIDSLSREPKMGAQDKQKVQKNMTLAKLNNEISLEESEIGGFKSRKSVGNSDESIKISIKEKYLSEDISTKQRRRKRWSWGDSFTKRALNAIRSASRKVFRKRVAVEPDAQEGGEDSEPEGVRTDVVSEVGSVGGQSTKRKKLDLFSRWRQKLKKTKNKDPEKPRKPKNNLFFFWKRKKRKRVELPGENRAESAAMT